jgi:hypothetical protein
MEREILGFNKISTQLELDVYKVLYGFNDDSSQESSIDSRGCKWDGVRNDSLFVMMSTVTTVHISEGMKKKITDLQDDYVGFRSKVNKALDLLNLKRQEEKTINYKKASEISEQFYELQKEVATKLEVPNLDTSGA